jgi:hypothetical protein
MPIFSATKRQFTDWIFQTDEFRNRISMSSDDWVLWRFYAALNPQDRITARDPGFLLVMADPEAVAKYFEARLAETDRTGTSDGPERRSDLEVMTRSDVISTMVIRVVLASSEKPGAGKKHTYRIELEGTKDGERVRLNAKLNMGLTFPVYSLVREAVPQNPDDKKLN